MLFWSILLFFLASVHSANILVIVPFPSWSHQQPFIAISKELIKRGHHITIITSDPPKENIENLTSIDISSSYERMGEFHREFGFTMQKDWIAFIFVTKLSPLFAHLSDHALSGPNVQEFLRTINQTKYDLVILEHLMFSSFSGLVHKIGSPPVVGLSTLPNNLPTDWAMGVPINPSYMPDMFVGYTDKMDFFQRVYNTIFYWWMKYQVEMRMIPMQERVSRKHFGYDAPSAREFEQNKSLVLMSTDLTLTYPMPTPPNVIQIGPLHIKPANPLPKELEEWCDSAEDGIVYFSLGSNMKGTSLKEEKREAFVKAFAKFPKIRFLWKWESDVKIPGLSSNVLTRKWFPQQDIFGHKKLRLFIMQGGLQSLQEAINYGIPILGIPLFADQRHNTWKMAKEGAGISLEMRDVTTESVYNILKTILYDEKDAFKNNASRLSNIAKDKLISALDTAAWWIEYVIRHNGAKHLRMASFDLSWYQISLIDVYGFLLIVSLFITTVLYYGIKTLTHKIVLSVSKEKIICNKDNEASCSRTAACKTGILKNNLEEKKRK